jgi:hypothetical protein
MQAENRTNAFFKQGVSARTRRPMSETPRNSRARRMLMLSGPAQAPDCAGEDGLLPHLRHMSGAMLH